MSIGRMSSIGFTGSKHDNSQEIESLRREKERLQQELSEIRTDVSMNSAEKKVKLQSISTKLSTISGKIQNLAKADTQSNAAQNIDVTNNEKKKKLIKEKNKLQSELAEVNSSANIDIQEKNIKIHKIMMEINSIQNEIRDLNMEDVQNMQYPAQNNSGSVKSDSREKLEDEINLLLGFDKDKEKRKGIFLNKLNILA